MPTANLPVKPGWRTSECWITAFGVLLTAATTLGIVTQADAQTIQGGVAQIAGAIGAISAIAALISKYVQGRHDQKLQAVNLQAIKDDHS